MGTYVMGCIILSRIEAHGGKPSLAVAWMVLAAFCVIVGAFAP